MTDREERMRETMRDIAWDCLECAQDAEAESAYSEARAWRAVAAKINTALGEGEQKTNG